MIMSPAEAIPVADVEATLLASLSPGMRIEYRVNRAVEVWARTDRVGPVSVDLTDEENTAFGIHQPVFSQHLRGNWIYSLEPHCPTTGDKSSYRLFLSPAHNL